MKNYYQKNPITQALKRDARKNGIPLYGAFELTSRCNFQCPMCYVHTMNNSEALKSELSTEHWKSIMDAAYDSGMLFSLFTGGECLLRHDFKELYLHLYQKGVVMSVNTNASLLNDDFIGFFINYPPERVQISLYGSTDDAYKATTGVGAFHIVTHAIKTLIENSIFVEVAVTANSLMKDDYSEILKYVKDNQINYSTSTFLIPSRESEEEFSFSAEEQLYYAKVRNEIFGKSVIAHEGLPPESGAICDDLKYGMPCNAGTIRFVVTSNGTMIPCMSIPDIKISLIDNTFTDCWKYIHDTMERVLQPSECSNCFYKKHCPICPVIRWKDFSSGQCRKELCTLQKQKYELGLI